MGLFIIQNVTSRRKAEVTEYKMCELFVLFFILFVLTLRPIKLSRNTFFHCYFGVCARAQVGTWNCEYDAMTRMIKISTNNCHTRKAVG